MKSPDFHLLLVWMTLTGIVIFGAAVSWDLGLLQLVYASDQSKLSLVTALLFIVTGCHCGARAFKLSREIHIADGAEALIQRHGGITLRLERDDVVTGDGTALPEGFMSHYIRDLMRASASGMAEEEEIATAKNLAEIYSARLKGPHELGWFTVDLQLKIGLLGTIVGFILMLGSVTVTAGSLDIAAMQKILQQMSYGMGTALYTTLAGLIASMLTGLQYLLLDRSADDLIARTIHLVEVQVLPLLRNGGRT